MAQRYFMHLAYRGTNFHGWQRQPGDISVQQVLEEALGTILRAPVPITGAGRTDAGVSARMMIAHFDAPEPLADVDRVIRGLNSICGPDIVVYSIKPVHDSAHARFDATQRTYRYYACTSRTPFLYPLVWSCSPNLDFEAMNEAAELLLEVEDFTSFSKLHTDVKTNICHVTEARWICMGEDYYAFQISADRFLRNMVRAVVGTLVEVGRGQLTLDGFKCIIEARDRCAAGTSMPGHALYLWDIKYPYYKP
ncbi:MAG: tRNA pseudouridine(38-40) synthase TruA [Muribaculaceae bacterium]|nr:tRNA pseudouridine(38-40) synthase TruA [Muribaculaceae bacterium]